MITIVPAPATDGMISSMMISGIEQRMDREADFLLQVDHAGRRQVPPLRRIRSAQPVPDDAGLPQGLELRGRYAQKVR